MVRRKEKSIANKGTVPQLHCLKCWNCEKVGHQAKDCQLPKRESTGQSGQTLGAKMVQSGSKEDPVSYLLSDSDDDEEPRVGLVKITDGGSKCQRTKVTVGGVPLLGIVDSGADVTIMDGVAFKQVASVAKLRKRDFKKPNEVPKNYDLNHFASMA